MRPFLTLLLSLLIALPGLATAATAGKTERPVERAVSASNTTSSPRVARNAASRDSGSARPGLTWRPTSAARRKTVVAEGVVAGDIIGRIKAQPLRLAIADEQMISPGTGPAARRSECSSL